MLQKAFLSQRLSRLPKEPLAKLFVSVILNEGNDLNFLKMRDSSLRSA
jgi:hypothetical protein